MIPLLTQNAVKIKSGFTNACMTGNYECAYALGILSAAAGLTRESEIVDLMTLHSKVMEELKGYEAPSKEMNRLVEMLAEYEPSEKLDEQMIELYYVGFDKKEV